MRANYFKPCKEVLQINHESSLFKTVQGGPPNKPWGPNTVNRARGSLEINCKSPLFQIYFKNLKGKNQATSEYNNIDNATTNRLTHNKIPQWTIQIEHVIAVTVTMVM